MNWARLSWRRKRLYSFPLPFPPLLPITTAHFGVCTLRGGKQRSCPTVHPHPSLPFKAAPSFVLKCCLFRKWQTPSASLLTGQDLLLELRLHIQAVRLPKYQLCLPLFTSSQNWSSVKVKCIKNLEGFGLKWHARSHRGGLWQNKCGHVVLQSVGLTNYWDVLLPTRIASLSYPKVWWLFAPRRIVCTGASLQSVLSSFFITADTVMPLPCFYNLCPGNHESWEPDPGRESPCTRYSLGNPLSIVTCLAYAFLCLCSGRKASQTRETCSLVLFLVQQRVCKNKILPRRRKHWESNPGSGCTIPDTCCWQCKHSLVDNISLHRYLLFHLTENYNGFLR